LASKNSRHHAGDHIRPIRVFVISRTRAGKH
jgi:hypothetical protein